MGIAQKWTFENNFPLFPGIKIFPMVQCFLSSQKTVLLEGPLQIFCTFFHIVVLLLHTEYVSPIRFRGHNVYQLSLSSVKRVALSTKLLTVRCCETEQSSVGNLENLGI